MKKHALFYVSVLIYLLISQSISMAQEPIIITVSSSEYMGDLYEDTIIPLFEEEHPNIQVEFVYSDNTYFGSPLFDPPPDSEEAGYYERLTDYASSADVLYVTNFTLSPFASQTGFFLDLMPLVNADSDIMPDDFYPAAWNAFQWDGGMWAMPYNLEPQLLVYNKSAFDEVNYPYPDGTWRIEDYIAVAEAMHTYNSQGEVELSPLVALNPMYLMYGNIGPTYDATTLPAQPDFSSPELLRTLEAFATYDQAYEFAEFQGYSFNEIPMSVSFPYQLAENWSPPGENSADWSATLLPGDIAGARVEGFAISSGTAYPEAAYEFVSFMTNNLDVLAYGYSSTAARRSLSNVEIDEETTFSSQPEFDPEIQALLDQALEAAIPPSELRYADVFSQARNAMREGDVDAQTAIEEVETKILDALEKSAEYQSTQIFVAAPELRPELEPGQIVLNFGMNTARNINELDNLWQDTIDEFVASHPTVGEIDLDYQIYGPDGMDEEIACWYNSYGGGFSNLTEPPEGFLALDPLLTADPNFDPNAFLPGVLDGVRVQDSIYGYPLTVQPMVMWINPARFEEANLPIPETSWTTNDFANALVALAELREDPERPVVRTNMYGASWFVMLLASFGGQPIDYNTNPVVYDLTNEENVAAMQQVISYIEDGLIDYSGLVQNGSTFFGGSPEDEYIVIDVMGDMNFAMQTQPGADYPLIPITYPDGVMMPVAYSLGMAHINSEGVYIQECYDWIQAIAQHPELFNGMPSRPAQFENPALVAQQSADVVDFYTGLTASLTAPNIMTLPDVYGSVPSTSQGAWLEPNFFYHAIDNVVQEDADLMTELQQAEAHIATFRECTAGINQLSDSELNDLFERDQSAGQAYFRQFVDCAVTLVPEFREIYSYYYQDLD